MENQLSYILDTHFECTNFQKCKQLDNRPMVLTILDNTQPYVLTGATFELKAKKPDGTFVIQTNNITFADNVVTINPLHIDAVRLPGTVKLELKITKSALSVATFTFELEVFEGVIQEGDPGSTNTLSAIEDLNAKMVEANGVLAQVDQATEDLNNLIISGGAVSVEDYNIDKYGKFGGKKYVAIGDSITVGFVTTPYPNIVATKCNLTLVNLGISGSSIGENGVSPSPIYGRLDTIPTDANLISIFAGTNDFGYNTPIGMSGDIVNTTFYGAMRNICEYLQTNFKDAQVFFITPMHRLTEETENTAESILEDYVNVIKDVCNQYAIPVLDMYADASFNIRTQTTYYSGDGLHPNQLGHDWIGQKVSQFILNTL